MGLLTWKCSYVVYVTLILETEKQLQGLLNDMTELFGKKRDHMCMC